LVPVIALVAGLLFATSREVSAGVDLRSASTTNLADLVRQAEARVAAETAQANRLQRQLNAATDLAGQADAAVAAARAEASPLRAPAGLTAVSGPGLTVTLDDSHDIPVGPSLDVNQLVVHQSDIQSVVNALWAGGAEAMTISGERIIATSAVRCVGNTLLLNGRVFSAPFPVVAIGPTVELRAALDRSPGVKLFKQAASYYGLGYTVTSEDHLTLPAYTGPLGLTYAKAG